MDYNIHEPCTLFFLQGIIHDCMQTHTSGGPAIQSTRGQLGTNKRPDRQSLTRRMSGTQNTQYSDVPLRTGEVMATLITQICLFFFIGLRDGYLCLEVVIVV